MNALANAIVTPGDTQTGTSTLTIADAQRILASWTDLAPGRATKLRTALATAARVLARDEHPTAAAAVVPFDCMSLRRLLQAPAATFGLSPERRTSLCSELRYILRRLDRHDPDDRGQRLSSDTLQPALESLPGFRQLALVDFLRFLEARNIAPNAVDADTLGAYEARCATRTLCADPRGAGPTGRGSVELGAPACGGLARRAADPCRPRGQVHLPADDLPGIVPTGRRSLQRSASRREHRRHLLGRSPRRGQAPSAPVSPAAASIHRGAAVDDPVCRGRPHHHGNQARQITSLRVEPHQITSLRDLVDPLDRPKAIIRFYLERGDGQSSPMAERIARTLRLIARDYCRLPEDHVAKIAAWAMRVELPKQTGLTAKNATRLRALMQPRARAMLLCLPTELMRRAAAPNTKPEEAARNALYATALEILLICPMRRGNLGGLRLDRHLHRPDPRKRKITHIIIEGDETKNGNPIHWPLPLESGKLIETFLTRYRHHLVDPGNPFLFGSNDRQRSAQHLGEHLSQIITREIGVEFNIHLARHFAAWNFLRQNPGQVPRWFGKCSGIAASQPQSITMWDWKLLRRPSTSTPLCCGTGRRSGGSPP